ncbi:MAG TPA: hypothetical protein VHC22_32655 [Pirellulales bacterium]|nr:hypothetical protein [Pirellulales bacterium]
MASRVLLIAFVVAGALGAFALSEVAMGYLAPPATAGMRTDEAPKLIQLNRHSRRRTTAGVLAVACGGALGLVAFELLIRRRGLHPS